MGFAKKALKSILPYSAVRLYEKRHEFRPQDAPLDNNKIAVISTYDVKYTELLHGAIKTAGYKSSDKASDAKYIWLHWYENGLHDFTHFVNKVNTLRAWKQQGRRIIFHIHNKKPHESKIPNVSHALMTVLADSADHISIMSTQTKDVLKDIWYYGDDFSNVSYVPHPNYIDAYGKKLNTPTSLNDAKLKILFFGLVRPYKGIEHLLEATDNLNNIEIGIYGKPKDEEYVAELKALCSHRDNVKFRLEHIPDSDIPQIFANYHIVALPYSLESSLNSGAAILSLSYARTVIGTNNGTLKELGDTGVYFGYDYKHEEDHAGMLRETIKTIQAQYDGRYNDLLKVGESAFEVVKKDNSREAVAKAITAMVSRIG